MNWIHFDPVKLNGEVLFRKIKKINLRTEFKKTLEFGVIYAKGVFVFIHKKWWVQLAKYPSVSWRVISITIR